VPLLDEAQMAELLELVLNGPDPDVDKVVRWRCVDLRAQVARRFSVEVTVCTIGRWLRQLNLTRLQPRPFHPKKDLAAQETFKNVWPAPSARGFFKMNHQVCFNVSDLGASPRPRWRFARPGPHKLHDVFRATF
jgi:hypothetical protein